MSSKLQVKRPSILLFDFVETVVKTSLVDQVLWPYIESSSQQYLLENWGSTTVEDDIGKLRDDAITDLMAPQIPEHNTMLPMSGEERFEFIKTVCKYVQYCQTNNRHNRAIQIFRLHMWFDGYRRERLQTPVYSDAAKQLRKWKEEGVQLWVVSNGYAQATKQFLSKTNHGNLNSVINGYFDNRLGPLDNMSAYRNLLTRFNCGVERILFLTKSAKKATAALGAGINTILVLTHRRNIEKLTEEEAKIPHIRMLSSLNFTD